jgi:sigma-E factor negative regulatory protein RseC
MTETGLVIKETKGFITVRFERKTECSKCKMCAFSKDMTHFDMDLENTVNAREGDTVTVSMQGGAVLLSSLIVYIIPLIFTALGLIGGYLIGGETIAVIGGAFFLALGFLSLSFLDKYLKRKNKGAALRIIAVNSGKNESIKN